MADSSLPVGAVTNEKLQTYKNTIGGVAVHSEAVTLTDTSGSAVSGANPLPVSGSVALDAATLAALETIQFSNSIPAGSNTIGKVDQRTLVNVRNWSQFYNMRSQRFIATTGYVTCALNNARLLALLRNPSGSGKVMMLDQAEFGATNNCRFSRYGGGTTALVGTPTKRPVGATDGSSSTAVAELYIGGDTPEFSVSVEGTLRKVAAMLAYDTYQILQINGTAVLKPGQAAYWRLDEATGGGGGTYTAYIDFEWVEVTEAEFAALQTAMMAMPIY